MPVTLSVEEPSELLLFLFTSLPDVKRTTVRQWLKHASVQVNGRPVTRGTLALRAGDRVSIRDKREALAESLLPPEMKLWFEDASLLVVDKPPHLLSVASATERHATAYALLTDYVRRGDRRSGERVWIVHRLDRECSGLMVFARSEAVKRALQAAWGEADKRYLAVVEGGPPAERATLRSHLDESGPYKVYSARESSRTRLAVTHYRVVARGEDRALVELTPRTGRRNQIRVHLADAGCPIVGDSKYGARSDPAGRLALHATRLRLGHPVSGERLRFESPLPAELARLLR